MQARAISLVALLLLSLHCPGISSSPLSPRDVQVVGPAGNVSLLARWRDTVGTATQVSAHGAASAQDVFQTDRSGPLSNVYRSTLGTEASTPCVPDSERKCEVAIDGFGTVGEVHFVFESSLANIKGRSTQVMIACRCLSEECGDAVLVRPIDVRDEQGNQVNNGTCIYEAVDGNFTDCHTELLRVTYRDRGHRPNYMRGTGAFNYSVTDPNYGDFWNATGQRGWERDCTDRDVNELSVFDSAALRPENVAFNVHETNPSVSHCKPPTESVTYFREEEAAGEECSTLFKYAAAAAAHRATQQDEIAIGNVESSYVYPKPELVSDTELALSCSGAGLGLLFVWSMFRKQQYKRNATMWYILWVATIQVLSFLLEALPLHTALGSEISAREWVSQFASVDGTVALAKGHSTPQGSAEGSVLILTSVLGEVRYRHTRVGLLAGLTVFFDITVLTLVVLTFLRKLRVRHMQKRGLLPMRMSKDPEFSSKLPSMQLMPDIRLPGTRRRSRKQAQVEEIADDSLDLGVLSETTTTGKGATVSPGTSDGLSLVTSRRSGREEDCEQTDDSLRRPASGAGTVSGLASFLIGDENEERSEGGVEMMVESVWVGEEDGEDGGSEGRKDPVSSGEESERGCREPVADDAFRESEDEREPGVSIDDEEGSRAGGRRDEAADGAGGEG